jgi:corrinoid protein of di/trimethylamine methyltransferase
LQTPIKQSNSFSKQKETDMSEELLKAMSQSIIDGESEIAADLARQSIEAEMDPLEAITKGYVVGVNQVGDSFACGDVFLPELVMAGEAMKAAIAVLEPELKKKGASREILGKVILATVEGDIHEIGKSLVGTMLTASGFEVYDLGVNVPLETILRKIDEIQPDILGLSALLTTTMVRQKEVIETLDSKGLRARTKVMIGGAPVTSDWVSKIGADGYSEDAIGAVNTAKLLMDALP